MLPASERICLSPPDVTEGEEVALVRALRSGWVAPLGPEVDAFEAELALRCGRSHAVALSSGTAALHLGLLALGVGPGDLVVTSTLTFAATANAVIYTGARPVFVDCDTSGNMDPALLASTLTHPSVRGRVKAIVPVDLLGKVADHAAIGAIAQRHGIPVLSDAAESLGATLGGRPAAAHGLVAALSFNGNKIMTTSGGGALLTDDARIAARVRHLATQAREPVVHYEHTEVGYNYRLSNLLAALGRAQLSRLDEMIEHRRHNRMRYLEIFRDVRGVRVFGEDSGLHDEQTHDNWWLSAILVSEAQAGFSSEDLRLALESNNIEARPMWKPMHLQPVFRGATSFVNGTSQRLFAQGLALPSGSALTDEQIDRVHGVVGTFLQVHRAA
ncbi:DegT/DnrJ/EryC1/StrS family aminotransferase [Knoellia sp. Soil729]|uniref:DegT/DnrJ/EryC1/StrS family aminotransferase n=1 Tax=Knoellia sp. Soil729 TaxID=1736394 RepID=UPI0006FA460B|nr:aminotransferase class I/II-fold pyridoxal phosphate-dependent enzyme [Knoellia sp. Soil729]KRE44165.1 pyridoxal-5'-phosphate-dependent protein [Knoellia sp. Soil729]